MQIKKLPPNIIAKVAAGEVIDRPSSVVKELIENAIDAKANEVLLEIENAGLSLIRISDNGTGIEPEDLKKSYKRHTTSKIYNEEDLFSIKTLGFRGEALYSISSISNTVIKSKTKNSIAGYKIEIEYGKAKEVEPIGIPEGTIVEVRNLFSNIPARKRFLNKKRTEFKNILEVVEKALIANYTVGFTLKHNNKTILKVPQNQTLLSRIKSVWGKQSSEELIQIKAEENYIKLKGFTSKPQFNSKYNKNVILFVNNRYIKEKEILEYIKNAYESLLAPNVFPKAIVFIQIPPEKLDVNIHPRKEEVFINNKSDLLKIVTNSIKTALNKNDLTYKIKNEELYAFNNQSYKYVSNLIKENVTPWNFKKIHENEVIQIGKLYLVTQTEKGLMLIDQHAAHEKILYNQFLEVFEKVTKPQELQKPLVIELSHKLSQVLNEHKRFITKLGFKIEVFGINTYKVTKAPFIFHQLDLYRVLTEVLEDLENEKKTKIDSISKKIISHLACRTAVKANEYLLPEERKNLVQKVLETKDQVYTCPHGRPVMVEIGLGELDKMFKRK